MRIIFGCGLDSRTYGSSLITGLTLQTEQTVPAKNMPVSQHLTSHRLPFFWVFILCNKSKDKLKETQQTWNFLHLLRQEIKVPLLRLMRSTLSQTLPQNCSAGVDNHANLFAAVQAKLGRNCRRRHRCEYFAPVWGSL